MLGSRSLDLKNHQKKLELRRGLSTGEPYAAEGADNSNDKGKTLKGTTGVPSIGMTQIDGQWGGQGKLALWFCVVSDARTLGCWISGRKHWPF